MRRGDLSLVLLALAIVALVAAGFLLPKKTEDSAVSELLAETLGLIRGVVFNNDGLGALIGIDFVREGDSIHGIKVIKINEDRVEFEKNGKRWTQGLNEIPGPQWQ